MFVLLSVDYQIHTSFSEVYHSILSNGTPENHLNVFNI